jgi:tyrosine-protein kinase Etk/Wzc
MENQDSLLGVIRTLVKWRKPIIVTTLIAAVGSSIIVLLIPVFFQATTIFYAASPDLSMPERIFGTTNQAMEYYGKDEDIDRIMTIAKSGELAEYLIRTYGLYGHYDIDTTDAKAPYWVREKLDKLYNVQKTKYDAIELSVEDTDPELSARIANDARRKIDEIAQRLIKNSQLEVLKTYESSIAEKQSLLDALSDSLQIIRSRYEVFNTKTQSEILSNMLARAEARFSAAQARKAVFDGRTGVPRDSILFLNAAIAGSSEEVKVLNRKLERFNKGWHWWMY